MNFLKQMWMHPKTTWAITASWRNLSTLITDIANLEDKKCVVELWPGTGVFTKKIITKIPHGCSFFWLEINSEFVDELNKNYPNVKIYNAWAQDIKKYLSKHQKTNCDCIISGIPWAALDTNTQKSLLNKLYEPLEVGWEFLTFAYIHWLALPAGVQFKRLLNQKFKKVEKSRIVWRNLPPAFVYRCTK